ncbi:MAG: cation-translocating P-type ATPase [Candidatus Bipolaricaulis sp.]|nr:cation-translocating P-type ATPase [Candidatus Bipolaricaulis sp.]MDD5219353.1 cation-translocating P-type ATPase [Candidatus Bipolaricaulis sp.]MDD5645711.1 cation-translocating P-type ATPase [Candidatus Bipolaricaulis sp.]
MTRTSDKTLWHALDTSEAVRTLKTDVDAGLSSAEAAERLKTYGPNALPESPPTPFWKRLVGQLKGFVVLILLVAAVISTVVYFIEPEPLGWLDSVIIIAIVVLNSFVGALQDSRAEKALQSLKKMAAPEAQVLRDGQRVSVRARELVPGDVVLLEAGTMVPADLRLLVAAQMRVDESSLTGESVPVEKNADAHLAKETGIADRINSAFLGTTVVYGRGRGVVIGTGADTQLGEIAEMIEEEQEETPLQRKLEEFGKILGTVILIVCAIVFALEIVRDPNLYILREQGLAAYFRTGAGDLIRFFMVAVSLAVAAVPEGLPAIVTMCLALGTREMLKRHALVRRLPSVETLGSATVICTDKTGTLTQNQMTVTSVWAERTMYGVTGQGYDPAGGYTRSDVPVQVEGHPVLERALWAGLLCNDAELRQEGATHRVIGDPTEGALVVAAAKGGMGKSDLERSPRISEIPFDSDRKRMTTFHTTDGARIPAAGAKVLAVVKGAPDVVLSLCARMEGAGGPAALDVATRNEVQKANDTMASQGLRVLAVAYRPLSEMPHEVTPEAVEHDLVLLGLLGMQDPPRPEVKDAITKARAAGLRTIMITGDHVATAEAIAAQIGLMRPGSRVVSGAEMDKMAEGQLAREIEHIDVFARVSPHHKVEIVEALRSNGEVVAMTGDGVNDAPALKRADIGVAMGIAGTDVAKNTADMVLTDDNYASIVAAVEQGRVIYSNIRKTVYYLLSCNFAEVAIIFGAILIGWPAPLTAIQLLWLNLLTDGAPALALGLEKGEPGIMSRRPRSPRERIINKEMAIGILYQAGALTVAVLGVYALGIYTQGALHDDAMTIAFTTLVLAELFRAYTARSEHVPLARIGVFSNRAMQWAVLASLALLMLVLYVPGLQQAFDTKTLSVGMWAYIAPLMLVPALVVEVRKYILQWRGRAKTA